jgi:hypothetical protein
VSKSSGWDQRLQVASGGKGMVGHAGAVLLRRCADRTGLTGALNTVLPRGKGPGWWDRGTVLVCLATAIVLGATSMSDISLLAHQALVFADPPSEATVRRALAGLDTAMLGRIGKARAKVRARVWDLLARRPDGFPWLSVAGKVLTGWVVIDLDATLITAHSDKQMNRLWRTVKFTVGWTITEADERSIAALPAHAWTDSLRQDGTATDQAQVAELTGLNERVDKWTRGLRLIARRTRPAARHRKKLTELEKKTGWRYAIVATNIGRIHGVPGSHRSQFLDVVHRSHATVQDRVRTNKAMGLTNLPSQSWTVNQGWVLAANIAADLAAWTRLLGLHDQPELAHAEPDTLRYRLLQLPAKLATHARRRTLTISDTWPWAEAFPALLATPRPARLDDLTNPPSPCQEKETASNPRPLRATVSAARTDCESRIAADGSAARPSARRTCSRNPSCNRFSVPSRSHFRK